LLWNELPVLVVKQLKNSRVGRAEIDGIGLKIECAVELPSKYVQAIII
jgi:hypothetical protein